MLNTHYDHIGHLARQNSSQIIKERLGRMVNDLPVVVTGDFNVEDQAPAYQKMISGIFHMQDAHKVCKPDKGPTGTYHDFGRKKPDECPKIDYIFVSDAVKVKSSRIIDSSLGDGFYLSDHNALCVELTY